MLIKKILDNIFLPLIIIASGLIYIDSKSIPVIMVASIILYTYSFIVVKKTNNKNIKAIKTLIYIGLIVSFFTSILLGYDIKTIISNNIIESLELLVFIGSIISAVWAKLERK